MKVSRNWLNNFFDTPLPDATALADALTFHAFEIDGIEIVRPTRSNTEDQILDVKVTPNRGHDCLSHRGIAKELSAILKLPFVHDPFQNPARLNLAEKTDAISVVLEDPSLSPRYIAGYIKGVKVGPSPDWLKHSLESIGQRSINNIVDATNFVMFNTGQPLHAFDAGKLTQKDGKFLIVVRKARAGEKLLALDGKEYALADSMLVIAEGNKDLPTGQAGEPVGIAGVKGGTPAGITQATTDIIIESANFSGVSVRKTSQALKLRTDASARFEQVISPELAAYGMQNVVEIILAIACPEQSRRAGEGLIGYADVYPTPQAESRVSVSVEKVNRILGTELAGAEVADAFARLQFAYKEEGGVFDVAIPFERLDITIPEDLVEEVGRIVGYDKVPTTSLPPSAAAVEINQNFYTAEHVRQELTAMGYSEVFTSVFADRGEIAVLNKVDSVRPYLRANLTDGLNEALKKNIPNKDLLGLKEVKLFEIGTVWKDGREETMAGIVTEKEKEQEEPLSMHAPKEAAAKYEDLPLSQAERFKPFSKYPYIVRDIAMWTPEDMDSDDAFTIISDEAGKLLVRCTLFDEFKKEEKTSLAFRLVFQSFDRTLTEVEVNAVMEKISAALKQKGFEIR